MPIHRDDWERGFSLGDVDDELFDRLQQRIYSLLHNNSNQAFTNEEINRRLAIDSSLDIPNREHVLAEALLEMTEAEAISMKTIRVPDGTPKEHYIGAEGPLGSE